MKTSKDAEVFDRRFRSTFGVSPKVAKTVFRLLQRNKTKEEHLVAALHFLKCYRSEEQGAVFFSITEKTYRKWVWTTIQSISEFYKVSVL